MASVLKHRRNFNAKNKYNIKVTLKSKTMQLDFWSHIIFSFEKQKQAHAQTLNYPFVMLFFISRVQQFLYVFSICISLWKWPCSMFTSIVLSIVYIISHIIYSYILLSFFKFLLLLQFPKYVELYKFVLITFYKFCMTLLRLRRRRIFLTLYHMFRINTILSYKFNFLSFTFYSEILPGKPFFI